MLVAWGLENSSSEQGKSQAPSGEVASSKRQHIDFLGAILISATIVSLLLAEDLPGRGSLGILLWYYAVLRPALSPVTFSSYSR